MASDFIAVEVAGEEPIYYLLDNLPDEVMDSGVEAVNKYLIGILKKYPPQKHVSRKAAYGGDGFFSDRQRRWFFAALRSGELKTPYSRSNDLSNAWQQVGSGRDSIVANDAPYAAYVMGDDDQSRHEKLVGWSKLGDVLDRRSKDLVRVFEQAVRDAMKKLKRRK